MNSELPKTLPTFLWQAVQPQWKWFLCIVILPCFSALDQNAFPYCTKLLIDAISNFTGNRVDIYLSIAPILYFWLAVWIVMCIVWRFLDIVEVYFIPKLQANIRFKIFEYIEQHSHQYFSNEFAGGLANKISDIAAGGWDVLAFIFRRFVPVSVSIFISIFILSKISVSFSIIFTLFYFIHMGICVKLSGKSATLSDSHSERRSALQGNIVDSLSNIVNVRLFSRRHYELKYLQTFQGAEIVAHQRLLWSIFRVRFALEGPSLLMMTGVLYFLVQGWQQGKVSAGDFAFVIALSFSLMMSVWELGVALPNFFKDIGTCEQALNLIRIPHGIIDAPYARELVVTQGEIIFDKVNFQYAPGQDLFTNKNIVIKPGEKIGLVGFSGSGKSTFVNLILRSFELEGGQILIDGQNIKEVTQESLRTNIAMIPQDVTLFHRTLRENIKYGNLEASDAEIIAASKQAHCHEFIERLEQGYETLVGERGIKLSGGQRQRIAIARAILKNAPILILDEATSALDSVTEQYIQESLKQLMQGRTSIVIAHRLSTLLGMDKILVFDQGVIVEQGDHPALLGQKGHYARLWQMQAGGFLPA